MAVLLRRTVFTDNEKGTLRFHDWARTVTTIGTCWETFPTIGQRNQDNTDWIDECSRIDGIEGLSLDRHVCVDDGMPLVGGNTCRTGSIS